MIRPVRIVGLVTLVAMLVLLVIGGVLRWYRGAAPREHGPDMGSPPMHDVDGPGVRARVVDSALASRPHPTGPARREVVRVNGLLLQARDAALAGDLDEARHLLDTQEREYGPGLADDRAAVRVLVRCLEAPETTRHDAVAFLRDHPVARFRKEIRRACQLTRIQPRLHRVG